MTMWRQTASGLVLLVALGSCEEKPMRSAPAKPPAEPAERLSGVVKTLQQPTPSLREGETDLPPEQRIVYDPWLRSEIDELLERAKVLRGRAVEVFGQRQARDFPQVLRQVELSLVFPLIQPGMKKEDVIAIVGEPNNTALHGGPWYHLHMYMTHLVFENGVLVDSVEDLYRLAGSHYSEVSKVRALQRLAEIRPLAGAARLLSSGDRGIQTARALGLLHDARVLQVLAIACQEAARLVPDGHGTYQHTLAESMHRLTGLRCELRNGQDPEGLARVAGNARAWWARNKDKLDPFPATGWGPTAEGLQIRIAVDEDECRVGRSPRIKAQIRNVSDKPIPLCKHTALFTRWITTDEGVPVKRAARLFSLKPSLPAVADVTSIKPGESLSCDLEEADRIVEGGYRPAEWHVLQSPRKPGNYHIRAHYCGVDAYANASLTDAWTGVLTSNTITIRFVER